MFVPLEGHIQRRFLEKASLWVDGFIKWCDSWGARPGVGLDDPDGSLLTQRIFCESMCLRISGEWLPVAPHSFSHVFSSRIKHIISG